jgi:hypothetical protein
MIFHGCPAVGGGSGASARACNVRPRFDRRGEASGSKIEPGGNVLIHSGGAFGR